MTYSKERLSTTFNGLILSVALTVLSELLLRGFVEDLSLSAIAGRSFTLFLILFFVYQFSVRSLPKFTPTHRDILTLISITVLSLCLVGAGSLIAASISSYKAVLDFAGKVTSYSLFFAVPFAAGALILQAILGLHYSLFASLALSFIIAVYFPNSTILIPYVLLTSIAGAMGFLSYRSRSAYLKAGINVSITAILFALASFLNEGNAGTGDAVVRVLCAFLSGVLSMFIAAGITPIIEHIGGYVTDMRLIEMATLDHPLLKELSIQAQGTWNHSVVMGMMAEAAAEAVDANPVLARVGAYFHDVGKLKKPIYFIENQFGEENRHDRLSPSMSALIVRSHVRDGVDIARKAKLPEILVNFIPEHHGTSLIQFFYEKATKEAKENGGDQEVDRTLYTYPGPRPQTKEAAILMLADGIEAATRTLADPTLDRIQGLVQKKINAVFSSGELDECELTLKDLHKIARCFTRVLNGIYHQRIAYSEPAEKISERFDEENTKQEPPKEDLKRLGQSETAS